MTKAPSLNLVGGLSANKPKGTVRFVILPLLLVGPIGGAGAFLAARFVVGAELRFGGALGANWVVDSSKLSTIQSSDVFVESF